MEGTPTAGLDSFDNDNDLDLVDNIRGRVKGELEPGERLLWAAPGFVRREDFSGGLTSGVIAAIILSVPGVWSWVKIARDPLRQIGVLLFLSLFLGVVDVFVVLAVVINRALKRAERAQLSGTLYALTDRRAIIWTPVPSSGAVKIVTIPRGSVSGVHRVQLPDGSGDVLFKVKGSSDLRFGDEDWHPTGFKGVADVRRVEEQVRRTLIDQASMSGQPGVDSREFPPGE